VGVEKDYKKNGKGEMPIKEGSVTLSKSFDDEETGKRTPLWSRKHRDSQTKGQERVFSDAKFARLVKKC